MFKDKQCGELFHFQLIYYTLSQVLDKGHLPYSKNYIKSQKELNTQLLNFMWHLSFFGRKYHFRNIFGKLEILKFMSISDLFKEVGRQLLDESYQL